VTIAWHPAGPAPEPAKPLHLLIKSLGIPKRSQHLRRMSQKPHPFPWSDNLRGGLFGAHRRQGTHCSGVAIDPLSDSWDNSPTGAPPPYRRESARLVLQTGT
jgi:hypothetical protein